MPSLQERYRIFVDNERHEQAATQALRVMVALNVPLIAMPFLRLSPELVIWSSLSAYIVTVTDYRGFHYRKLLIQGLESLLMIGAALVGGIVSSSLGLSVAAMLVIGMFVAIIRNWSDHGPGVGVGVGFFFLLGLQYGNAFVAVPYMAAGCALALSLTLSSMLLRPFAPMKRSVAGIWRAAADFVLAMEKCSTESFDDKCINSELEMRLSVSRSVSLFRRHEHSKRPHYQYMVETRRYAALFCAALSAMLEHGTISSKETLDRLREAVLQMAITVLRTTPVNIARLRVLESELLRSADADKIALRKALSYLGTAIRLAEERYALKGNGYLESLFLSHASALSMTRPVMLMEFFRTFVQLNKDRVSYALRVGVILAVGVLIYRLANANHGIWIPFTALIVIQPYFGATRKKSSERIIGTLGGVAVGGLLMLVSLPHTIFVIMLAVVSFLMAFYSRKNYAVGVFFVTLMMVVLLQLSHEGTYQLIGWRMLSTVIGSALAILAGLLLLPRWEKDRLPVLSNAAVVRAVDYLYAVLLALQNRKMDWRSARGASEEANAEFFRSLQRMKEEPKGRQSGDPKFPHLVARLLALTRGVTTLALLAEDGDHSASAANLNDVAEHAVRAVKHPEDAAEAMARLDAATSRISDDFIREELQLITGELKVICTLR